MFNLTRFARDKYDHFALRSLLQSLGISLRSATEPIDDTSTGKLMEGVLAAFAQFDNDCRSDRTRAGMKAALELGRWVFLAPLGYINAPRTVGKSLTADPERAPLVRRVFEEYATGRFTKQQVLEQTRAWGLTNRRNRPLTSQAIGVLLSNQLYAGIVDVPEYGVRAKRGDFEPLISEELFYRVQSVLVGSRAEHDAPAACAPGLSTPHVRTLRGLWSRPHRQLVEGRRIPSPKMPLREGAAGAGLQVAFEIDSALFVGEFDGDVQLPGTVARGVGAAAGVVIGEAGGDVRGVTDVEVWLRIGVLENVDESLVFRHARPEATAMPIADVSKLTGFAYGLATMAVSATRPEENSEDSRRERSADRPKLCCRRARLRRCAATARQPSRVRSSLACRAEARPKGERRLVDLTGIEPVTS